MLFIYYYEVPRGQLSRSETRRSLLVLPTALNMNRRTDQQDETGDRVPSLGVRASRGGSVAIKGSELSR
jgi:hypothetical protein